MQGDERAAAAERVPAEVVLDALDQVFHWPRDTAGWSIAEATVGLLVLTSHRLLFLSSGTSGAAKRVLATLLLGPAGSVLFGRTRTDQLDLSALDAHGSLEIPLSHIDSCEAVRRWDLAMYLRVRYSDAAGDARAAALMTKSGFRWSLFRRWAASIEGARADRDDPRSRRPA